MKKLLTMLSVICVFALTVTAFAIFSSADGMGVTLNEGDIIDAQELVAKFNEATESSEKLQLAKDLNLYLFTSPISETVAKIVLDKIHDGAGEEMYNAFMSDVTKVMAYGAAAIMNTYDENAMTYKCRNVVNWASRFMEYDIADYTLDEVLAPDFFNDEPTEPNEPAESAEEGDVKTIGERYLELSNAIADRMQKNLDFLSANAVAEYVDQSTLYAPEFTHGFTMVANPASTKFNGVLYENGYRRDDYIPKFDFAYTGVDFAGVTQKTGTHDKVTSGTYVIFDEGVTDFYAIAITGGVPVLKENYVKRNYIYDPFAGGYINVGEGNGLYDLLDSDGYAQLLPADPYYGIDMTGVRVTSGVPYANWNFKESFNTVVQFDVTHFDEVGYVSCSAYFKRMEDSANSSASYFSVNNGNLGLSFAGKLADGTPMAAGYKFEDVIVPGRWTSVALVFNGSEMDLYIDYELVATQSYTFSMTITGLVQIRARVNGSDDRGIAFDNVIIYPGTMPRQLDKFETMGATDKFLFFGNYLSGGSGTPTAMMMAYDEMTLLLPSYFTVDEGFEGSHIDPEGNVVGGRFVDGASDEIKEAVKAYYSFDIETVIASYKAQNVKDYVDLVDEFCEIERSFASINSRKAASDSVLSFVKNLSDAMGNPIYIDVDSPEYQAAEERYLEYMQLLENDSAALEFVSAMESYKLLYKYNTKKTQFDNASKILNSITIDNSITAAGETRLVAAYAAYNNAPAELDDLLHKENTKNLAMYIAYTKQFDTFQSWEENYDKISYPITKAREIVLSGKYYKTGVSYSAYGDIEELLDWYELVNDYFYDKLQLEHITYITALHDRYMSTDSYMAKLGICTEVDRYLNEEDIDPTNEKLIQLRERNDEYIAEVRELEGPYILQRDQNTERFAAVTKKLLAAESYNDIVLYLEEALNYYYTMTVGATDNLTEEEFLEADNVYRYYIEYEKKVSESSRDFVILSEELTSDKKLSETYTILSEMYLLKDYVSEDIEGVGAALEIYENAYAAYETKAAPARTAVSEIERAIISLRANCDSSALMYIFAAIIGAIN